MPPKQNRTHYVCAECGEQSLRWFGRCPSCEAWNTLVEEAKPSRAAGAGRSGHGAPRSVPLASAHHSEGERHRVGEEEIDRVLGGGVVPGSLVLVGGEPGVGKSTLLLQLAALYSAGHGGVLYVSGEESARQVALRSSRLGLAVDGVRILSETRVEVVQQVIEAEKPELVIVDSIQTMVHPDLDSGPGSVGQVRESCNYLGQLAKQNTVSIFFVGHVNKQGSLAGPKVLEHAVDVVLNFEGERHTSFRILRAAKNRFGSTHEVGIFEMQAQGLVSVTNPSEFFLAERPGGSPGSVVTAAREGTRPMLVEIQALVGPTAFGGTPRRQVAGVDYNRVSIILAVLEKRVGMRLQSQDVYVNVAGGVRVTEPACDLGIAVAVASSFRGVPLDPHTVVFGEIGLAGEVRSVSHTGERMAEAARLGFRRALAPFHKAGADRGGTQGFHTAIGELDGGRKTGAVDGSAAPDMVAVPVRSIEEALNEALSLSRTPGREVQG